MNSCDYYTDMQCDHCSLPCPFPLGIIKPDGNICWWAIKANDRLNEMLDVHSSYKKCENCGQLDNEYDYCQDCGGKNI